MSEPPRGVASGWRVSTRNRLLNPGCAKSWPQQGLGSMLDVLGFLVKGLPRGPRYSIVRYLGCGNEALSRASRRQICLLGNWTRRDFFPLWIW